LGILLFRHERLSPLHQLFNGLAAGALIFAIVGCNEMILLLLSLSIWGGIGYLFWKNKKLNRLSIFLLVVDLFSCYLVFSAPGNAERINGNPMSEELAYSLTNSLHDLLFYTARWLYQTPLLWITLGSWPVMRRLVKEVTWADRFLNLHPFLALIILGFLLFCIIFPVYWGGIPLPPRIMNTLYWYFLIGWLYWMLVWAYFWRNKVWIQWPSAVLILCVLISGWMLRKSPTLKMMYADLRSGRAARYDQELQQRYQQLRDNKGGVVSLKPLVNQPQSLYLEDIRTQPNFLWNTCESDYFEVKQMILLSEKTTELP
jgi:hypothetical protein